MPNEPAPTDTVPVGPPTGGSRVKICTTPPAALPYCSAAGPRSTSTRSADARLALDTWPWPSGMVAGMPSIRMRTPRMPKVDRVPKPRTESCRSCE